MTVFYCSDSWYALLRVFMVLCDRLAFFVKHSEDLVDDERREFSQVWPMSIATTLEQHMQGQRIALRQVDLSLICHSEHSYHLSAVDENPTLVPCMCLSPPSSDSFSLPSLPWTKTTTKCSKNMLSAGTLPCVLLGKL